MFMRKLLPILLALLFNAPVFAQIQLENGLPINVETNRVTLNELDKGLTWYVWACINDFARCTESK